MDQIKQPGEQCLFFDQLLSVLRIDTAAAKKEQTPHAEAPSWLNYVGMDF